MFKDITKLDLGILLSLQATEAEIQLGRFWTSLRLLLSIPALQGPNLTVSIMRVSMV